MIKKTERTGKEDSKRERSMWELKFSKCLCTADAKKQGLSKVWNLISAEKQGRKHWSSGWRGGGFIAMEFAQTSALQKHS